MIWAGSPYAQRIEFSTGLPTGAVSYQLLDNQGAVLKSDQLYPEPGAVSCMIVIDAQYNTVSTPLFEARTLTWTYLTPDGLVSERDTYVVQRPIPFPVSTSGVRSKLGVEDHELEDAEIDLMTAYSTFVDFFEDGALAPYQKSGDHAALMCIHAIEAIAGLAALPALQLRVAQRETTGTDEYQRYSKIDWSLIEAELLNTISRARDFLAPTGDQGLGNVTSFQAVGPTLDPFTGA